MQKLPVWFWACVACTALGVLGGGTLMHQLYPIFNVSIVPSSSVTPATPSVTPATPPVTPKTSNDATSKNISPEDLVNLKVVVRDIKSKLAIPDAEVRINPKEGPTTDKTESNGSVIFQIPKQNLGEVKATVIKEGYKTKDQSVVFAIDPNKYTTVELEADTSNPSGQGSAIRSKVNWGVLKTYFDIDDDVNLEQVSNYLAITVHLTAKKDFDAISFKAQPYDAYGVKTNITTVSFSYSPLKWKKGDRSKVYAPVPSDMSKVEIFY